MRCLAPCLLAALALAGGSYDSGPDLARGNPAPRASIEADADQVEIPVRITVTAPTRAAAEARMRVISARISTRFEDQDGLELARTEPGFAHPRDARGGFLSKSDKEPASFVVTSAWSFRAAVNEDMASALDRLREQTADLVDPKAVEAETESLRVGEPAYRLSNPEDYRDALLHRIREDAAEAAKHLPIGENLLEIPTLEQRVLVAPIAAGRVVLWLPYSLRHKSKPTKDSGKCGCEDAADPEEHAMDDGHDHSK